MRLTEIVLGLTEVALPQSRFFIGYLMCAALIGAIATHRSMSPDKRGVWCAIKHIFDGKLFGHRSAKADYVMICINKICMILEVLLGVAATGGLAGTWVQALTSAFGPGPQWHLGLWDDVAYTILVVLVADAAQFSFHWLQHRHPLLWELHKVHHSAEVMTPFTALRVHPLSNFVGAFYLAIFTSVPTTLFLYLFAGTTSEITVAGVNVVVFCWYTVLGEHLAHSHIWLMYPQWLRGLFYSPALHHIHHSALAQHHDKNFGFTFSIWDRWAGTLHEPTDHDRTTLVLGLEPPEMADLRTPLQLCLTPLRNIWRLMSARRTPQPTPQS